MEKTGTVNIIDKKAWGLMKDSAEIHKNYS
jgi:hypothetical protein